jgi:hypothetical protein
MGVQANHRKVRTLGSATRRAPVRGFAGSAARSGDAKRPRDRIEFSAGRPWAAIRALLSAGRRGRWNQGSEPSVRDACAGPEERARRPARPCVRRVHGVHTACMRRAASPVGACARATLATVEVGRYKAKRAPKVL